MKKSRLGIAQGLVLTVLAVLFVVPSPAGAATTTIGQLAPNIQGGIIGYDSYGYPIYGTSPPSANCSTAADLTSAMSAYAVPAGGTTITNWKTRSAAGSGQEMTLKVFRKVGEPATYEVIAHDGPRPLAAGNASEGGFNSFNVSIPVQPGDLVGLYTNSAATAHEACTFSQSGASYLLSNTSLLDGESAAFTQQAGSRPNLTADVSVPSASQHNLTVSVVGTGGGAGTVSSSPAGIESCASSCSHPFIDGTQVTLTASPGSYSEFKGWTGGGCSGQAACQVTVTADTAVTAEFAYTSSYGSGYEYPGGSYGPGGGSGVNGTPKCHRSKARTHCVRQTKLVAKRARNATLGKEVLTTRKGRTLYSLSAEHGGTFICTGSCLSIWHPLTVPAGVRPLGPVLLGTVKRPGIGTQVTYHGRPLYAFGGDTGPDEANGQGIMDVGTWGAVVVPPPKRKA